MCYLRKKHRGREKKKKNQHYIIFLDLFFFLLIDIHFVVTKLLSWLTFSTRQITFHSIGFILISRAGKLVYSLLINVYVRTKSNSLYNQLHHHVSRNGSLLRYFFFIVLVALSCTFVSQGLQRSTRI